MRQTSIWLVILMGLVGIALPAGFIVAGTLALAGRYQKNLKAAVERITKTPFDPKPTLPKAT